MFTMNSTTKKACFCTGPAPGQTKCPCQLEQAKLCPVTSCLHDACGQCNGTGVNKLTGGICVHMISCPCPKCTPRC